MEDTIICKREKTEFNKVLSVRSRTLIVYPYYVHLILVQVLVWVFIICTFTSTCLILLLFYSQYSGTFLIKTNINFIGEKRNSPRILIPLF